MLDIRCPDELKAARDHANSLGDEARGSLERSLSHLDRMGHPTVLWKDFAPYSFEWVQRNKDGSNGLHGGLIFHGPHDGGGNGGAPTFSVCLEPNARPHWQLHT